MSDRVHLTIDGREVAAATGTTLLQACRDEGIEVPTLCFIETLVPANACRICVVEVEGSRALVPACSRRVEEGMAVRTRSARVDHARRLVLEFLGSSVDLSTAGNDVAAWMEEYGANPVRFGPPAPAAEAGERDARRAGHRAAPAAGWAGTVAEPPRVDNDLYVRDLAKCILCYRCVDACGEQAQNSFAIAIAGRGFDARISTEFAVPLPDSACVFCGNCVAVCPTGALMVTTEYEMRAAGTWDEATQTVTRTVCAFCGVGCNLELHVQDGRIVKVTSPLDHDITAGNLCIKGRFGWGHVHADGA